MMELTGKTHVSNSVNILLVLFTRFSFNCFLAFRQKGILNGRNELYAKDSPFYLNGTNM